MPASLFVHVCVCVCVCVCVRKTMEVKSENVFVRDVRLLPMIVSRALCFVVRSLGRCCCISLYSRKCRGVTVRGGLTALSRGSVLLSVNTAICWLGLASRELKQLTVSGQVIAVQLM